DRAGHARAARGSRTEEQRALADRPDGTVDKLGLAVVANPVRSEIKARKPEDAGLRQFGKCLVHPLLGDGDVQVAPASRRAPARSIGSMTWPGISGEPGGASAQGLGVRFDSGSRSLASGRRAGGRAALAPGGFVRDGGPSPAPSEAKARRQSAGPIAWVMLF